MTDEAALLILELMLKSTVILGAAFIVTAAVKRLSSEERHVAWLLAIIGLLALPVAAVFGPAIELPLREMVPAAQLPVAKVGSVTAESRKDSTSSTAPPHGAEAGSAVGATRTTNREGAADGLIAALAPSSVDTVLVTAALYMTVALLLLVWFGSAVIRVVMSLRKLEPVTDQAVLARLEDARTDARIGRPLRLLKSPFDASPWAWGLIRPVIVVPASFTDWPDDLQRNALVHELSHVARLDFLTTLLGYLSCALYWFQPLAWLALSRMKRESEHACDDRVLLAGGSHTTYAAQLLEIARTIHGSAHRPMLGAAMARSSSVSQRIASILDLNVRRRTMGKTKAIYSLLLTAALVLPVASLKSQEDVSDRSVAEPGDAEFVALVQRGPSNSEELGLIVRTFAANARSDEATQVLVDYLSGDDTAVPGSTRDRRCAFCSSLLDRSGPDNPDELHNVVLAAFEQVEEQAYATGDGDLLIRLAESLGESEGSPRDRGLYYLVEGFRVGNLTDESKLSSIALLNDMGWYEPAKALVDQLSNDESSSLYQSAAMKRWANFLDMQIGFSGAISARLLAPDESSTGQEDEYVPIVKVAPIYPKEAAAQGREGSVVVEFTVTNRGRPSDISVVTSTDTIFDEAAVWAASQFRYLPRIEGGVPVDVHGIRNKITFVMGNDG